jgi:hypothetical protein
MGCEGTYGDLCEVFILATNISCERFSHNVANHQACVGRKNLPICVAFIRCSARLMMNAHARLMRVQQQRPSKPSIRLFLLIFRGRGIVPSFGDLK